MPLPGLEPGPRGKLAKSVIFAPGPRLCSKPLTRKKKEIQAWLKEDDKKIRTFAENYISNLDKQIASERRRSEQRIALRKREYGEEDSPKKQT